MRVRISVAADISLLDEDLRDPVAGDPMATRMQESARQAVATALELAALNGFSHDLDHLTSLIITSVNIESDEPA